MTKKQILPHGGRLIDRIASDDRRLKLLNNIDNYKKITISEWNISDLELIGIGGFSPLTGFLNENDYLSVLKNMRLANGSVWPIPITLSVSPTVADSLEIGTDILLEGEDKEIYGVLHLEEKYHFDKVYEIDKVYQTTDCNHPGVAKVLKKENINLGGDITLLKKPQHDIFKDFYKTPSETRNMFQELGWKTIVGFQTRNPIHRAHEYIQKAALEIVDGLLLNPLVGETKSDDIQAHIRMKSYQALLKGYFPYTRSRLVIYPAAMRYAGPKEAILHALVRKNYGCTHFIIGRDHAGVGNYYGTYDAQHIFEQFTKEEIGINILNFEHAFYCEICDNMATSKTCPHDSSNHLHLSGTKVRELLKQGVKPPKEFTRPEIAQILIDGINKSVLN